MIDRMFLCGDCSKTGRASALKYYEPPTVDGDSKSATQVAKTNNMCYQGCPKCTSPNVYFEKEEDAPPIMLPSVWLPSGKLNFDVKSQQPALGDDTKNNNTPSVVSEPDQDDENDDGEDEDLMLVDDDDEEDLLDEDEDEEEEPPPPPKKKKKRKGTTKKATKKRDEESDKILLQNQKAAKRSRRKSPLSKMGYKVAESAKTAPPDLDDCERAPDNADLSNLGVGKHREHVPRRKYKRECKNCGRDFETKHDAQGYCKRCLNRYAGG